ncbi:ANTAR domain-containing protein [Mycolicibacterium hodleri]|uniref:ANTAR domain-containing protein n=1 Tax=Mycolicibacterium hodleri TaxID=49897 RepID=A0A502EHT4_9MYCO|nr:ANTAR domain-containing protein [Mycolicibacterium hodleri]TPG36704.1 ANTAR domain-containing protein [Mycolicibacterium hodleri]
MSNTAALAAELEILTAALEEPGADVAHSLQSLMQYAANAVATYLGLSVLVARSEPAFAFTVLADGVAAEDVHTSLHVVVPGPGERGGRFAVTVTLYARSPGAFVDLAADLAWLTKSPVSDFVLDQHLAIPAPSTSGTTLVGASLVNQAVGVLIGRGYTPEEARGHIDAHAARARTDRLDAAERILAWPSTADGDQADTGIGIP